MYKELLYISVLVFITFYISSPSKSPSLTRKTNLRGDNLELVSEKNISPDLKGEGLKDRRRLSHSLFGLNGDSDGIIYIENVVKNEKYNHDHPSASSPTKGFEETSPKWRKKKDTIDSKLIYESPYLRVEEHKRAGFDDDDVWTWVDAIDTINIMIHLKGSNKFAVFNQTKYGVDSFVVSPIGGHIEVGELPLEAAKREALEEMRMKCEEYLPLGHEETRLDVNRGFGFVSTYLGYNCEKVTGEDLPESDELEAQEYIEMNWNQMVQLALNPSKEVYIGENRWSNTVAMSLLKLTEKLRPEHLSSPFQ